MGNNPNRDSEFRHVRVPEPPLSATNNFSHNDVQQCLPINLVVSESLSHLYWHFHSLAAHYFVQSALQFLALIGCVFHALYLYRVDIQYKHALLEDTGFALNGFRPPVEYQQYQSVDSPRSEFQN